MEHDYCQYKLTKNTSFQVSCQTVYDVALSEVYLEPWQINIYDGTFLQK